MCLELINTSGDLENNVFMKGIVQLCTLDLRELYYVIGEADLSFTPLNISQV